MDRKPVPGTAAYIIDLIDASLATKWHENSNSYIGGTCPFCRDAENRIPKDILGPHVWVFSTYLRCRCCFVPPSICCILGEPGRYYLGGVIGDIESNLDDDGPSLVRDMNPGDLKRVIEAFLAEKARLLAEGE